MTPRRCDALFADERVCSATVLDKGSLQVPSWLITIRREPTATVAGVLNFVVVALVRAAGDPLAADAQHSGAVRATGDSSHSHNSLSSAISMFWLAPEGLAGSLGP